MDVTPLTGRHGGTSATILYLVTGFPPDVSGASLYNWERALWLAQNTDLHVAVLAPDWGMADTSSQYPRLADNTRMTIITYPSKPWLAYSHTHVPRFRSWKFIESQIEQIAPDIIVVTDVERFFLLGLWRLPGKQYARNNNVPYIAEYVTDLYNFSASYPGWTKLLRSIVRRSNLIPSLYQPFTSVLCPSLAAKSSCEELGIRNAIVIRFYGTDISLFSPSLRNREQLATWLPKEELNNTIILYLGRLGWEKRVDLLISAFQLITEVRQDVSLLIVGDGPADVVNKLVIQSKSIPNVHFTGFLLGSTKAIVMASCDVFCSPCPYETFGRTTVEAMASGVPAVTVDAGAVKEFVTSGVNGYLVPPNDLQSLKEALLNLVGNSSDGTIKQRALADATDLSMDSGCRRLEQYYSELIASNKSNVLQSRY